MSDGRKRLEVEPEALIIGDDRLGDGGVHGRILPFPLDGSEPLDTLPQPCEFLPSPYDFDGCLGIAVIS